LGAKREIGSKRQLRERVWSWFRSSARERCAAEHAEDTARRCQLQLRDTRSGGCCRSRGQLPCGSACSRVALMPHRARAQRMTHACTVALPLRLAVFPCAAQQTGSPQARAAQKGRRGKSHSHERGATPLHQSDPPSPALCRCHSALLCSALCRLLRRSFCSFFACGRGSASTDTKKAPRQTGRTRRGRHRRATESVRYMRPEQEHAGELERRAQRMDMARKGAMCRWFLTQRCTCP
jgi:hypothetical protein